MEPRSSRQHPPRAPLNASRTRVADSDIACAPQIVQFCALWYHHRTVKHEKSIPHILMAILCPVPMTQNRDPDYWRAQATEARAAAADMTDPKFKRALERIATSYDMLARKAEEPKETARYLQKRSNKSN